MTTIIINIFWIIAMLFIKSDNFRIYDWGLGGCILFGYIYIYIQDILDSFFILCWLIATGLCPNVIEAWYSLCFYG